HLAAVRTVGKGEVGVGFSWNGPAALNVVVPKAHVSVVIEQTEHDRTGAAGPDRAEQDLPAAQDARINPRADGKIGTQAKAARWFGRILRRFDAVIVVGAEGGAANEIVQSDGGISLAAMIDVPPGPAVALVGE